MNFYYGKLAPVRLLLQTISYYNTTLYYRLHPPLNSCYDFYKNSFTVNPWIEQLIRSCVYDVFLILIRTLEHVPRKTWRHLICSVSVYVSDLSSNQLVRLEEGSFIRLSELKQLSIGYNQVSFIADGAFRDLTRLYTLWVQQIRNRAVITLHTHWISRLE